MFGLRRPALLRASKGLVFLVVLLVLVFIAVRAMLLRGDVDSIPTAAHPAFIAAGLALYGVGLLFNALLWWALVCLLGRRRVAAIDAGTAFCASWLGRYVPTSLLYIAGKVVMGERLGLSRRALAASVLYEHVIVLSLGAITSAVVVLVALTRTWDEAYVYAGTAVAGLIALAMLSPPFWGRMVNTGARLAKKEIDTAGISLSGRGWLICGGLAMGVLAANGASYALVLSAFVRLEPGELVVSAAALNLAGVVGVLAVPFPSGIGVREGVLVALMQSVVPLEVALASAIVLRLGGLIVDVVFGSASIVVFALRRAHKPDAVRAADARLA